MREWQRPTWKAHGTRERTQVNHDQHSRKHHGVDHVLAVKICAHAPHKHWEIQNGEPGVSKYGKLFATAGNTCGTTEAAEGEER